MGQVDVVHLLDRPHPVEKSNTANLGLLRLRMHANRSKTIVKYNDSILHHVRIVPGEKLHKTMGP